MSWNLDLPLDMPFGKSPEKILEEAEEKRPRMYAKDIFTRYREGERLQQVDRLVPQHLREMVRRYLVDWAMREKQLKGSIR